MTIRGFSIACLLVAMIGATAWTGGAAAAPDGVALVVSFNAYTSQTPLPACGLSARAIASQFKDRGFDVVALADPSVGQVDGAIAQLGERLRSAPNLPVALYVCGYAEGWNGRTFLLPIGATLDRPSDIMMQGILMKSLIDAVAAFGARPAMIALEAVPVPGQSQSLAIDRLDQADLPAGVGLLGVTTTPGDTSHRFAEAFTAGLKAPSVELGAMIDAIKQDTANPISAAIVLAHRPTRPSYLIGPEPPPLPAPPQPEQAPAPTAQIEPAPPAAAPLPRPEGPPLAPSASPPAAAPPAAPPAAQAAPPAGETLPDEEQMTDAQRRSVQTKLAALGYYGGPIDGIFATETRAAIRRLQHELQVTMTGRLTGAQAVKLMTLH